MLTPSKVAALAPAKYLQLKELLMGLASPPLPQVTVPSGKLQKISGEPRFWSVAEI
jgi:hypothetical protein